MSSPDSVVKPWVSKLTWKAQSALFTSIRGVDNMHAPTIRILSRWIRNITFYDADVDGTFVKYGQLPKIKDIKPELEYMTIHFAGHLMHGLQIIAYKHPDIEVQTTAFVYYNGICDLLHCRHETVEVMDSRLKDNRESIE